MARAEFSLAELVNLDLGKAHAAFQAELGKVIQDLQDRPFDDGKRTVTLKLELMPEELIHGQLETVKTTILIDSKVPTKQTRAYSMRVTQQGRLTFNPESPDDPNQKTLDEAINPDTGEVQ